MTQVNHKVFRDGTRYGSADVKGGKTMEDDRPLIATIERATDVLTLFAKVDRADLGVTEIAEALQLSKAVVHRVLTTLVAKGFVETSADTRRYRLGPTVLALGVAYLDRMDLRALCMPVLRQLSARTRETATLSLRYGLERMYIDQVTPDREVKMTVVLGQRFPLHAGSSSKAFLAFLQSDVQAEVLNHPLAQLTDATIVDPEALRADLDRIRERGYALSLGERQAGAGSVAAPILDHRGEPAAVLSVCGPLERFKSEIDGAAEMLLSSTVELSRLLGFRR